MVEEDFDFVGFEWGNDIPNHLHENREIGILWGHIRVRIEDKTSSATSGSATFTYSRNIFSIRCNSILFSCGVFQYAEIKGSIQALPCKLEAPSLVVMDMRIDDNMSNRPFKSLFTYDSQTIIKQTKNCCILSSIVRLSPWFGSINLNRKTVFDQQHLLTILSHGATLPYTFLCHYFWNVWILVFVCILSTDAHEDCWSRVWTLCIMYNI